MTVDMDSIDRLLRRLKESCRTRSSQQPRITMQEVELEAEQVVAADMDQSLDEMAQDQEERASALHKHQARERVQYHLLAGTVTPSIIRLRTQSSKKSEELLPLIKINQ
jgi:hypothetical protein